MSLSSSSRKALSRMACFNFFSLHMLLPGLLLGLASWTSRAAAGEPIKVVGFAVCDACRENRLSNFSLPIPGATITLACKNTDSTSTSTHFTRKAFTNKYGVFSFDLPFSEPRLLRMCTVELTNSSFKACITKTKYSSKVLSPVLSFKPKDQSYISYSSGWLSYQPTIVPSFCSSSEKAPTKVLHNNVQTSKNKPVSPQDVSFPFPPIPGFSPPPFPFNFFPPYLPFPGPSPFPGFPPYIVGFPPFPSPFPFPFSFPFPFILPFPYPYPFTPPTLPNPFSTVPPFPTIQFPPLPPLPPNPFPPVPMLQVPQLPPLPPNPFPPVPILPFPSLPPIPFSPSTPIIPFNPPTPSFNLPPLIPSPPSLQVPPLTPIPLFPSAPPNPFSSSLPPFTFLPFPYSTTPPHEAPLLPPFPFPPSNPLLPPFPFPPSNRPFPKTSEVLKGHP